jgi:hypothetical protein
MLYKNETTMKTRTLIAIYLILFLTGIAMNGFAQGISNSGGYITDAGTTSHSYIEFNGNVDMTLSGTTADQTKLGNVKVDFTGTGTYKLTIPNNSYVTVNGNLTLSDSLLLDANSSSNMASLITNGTVTGAYACVEQHLVRDQWHMVSSPVSSAVSGVYTGAYLYKWNEPDSTWAFITSVTEALTVTRGYHLYSVSTGPSIGPTDVKFTGLFNTGDYSTSLTYNAGSNKGDGWNEIGNPYPSALEWNSSWTKTNVDATIYIYDGTQYKTWNYNAGGTGSLSNGEIPPTQGFWVKANASSPSLTIPNAERIHSSNTFYKGDEIQNIIDIHIEGNGYSDEMCIGMYGDASDDFDSEYDAYKLMGIEAAPQLYAFDANTLYAVDLLAESYENREVSMGIRTGTDAEYTFSFEGVDNFDPSIAIYLEDKSSGEMIDLHETTSYSFYSEEGTTNNRFILHFNPDFTDVDSEVATNQIGIYAFDKTVCVNYQMAAPAQMHVFDLLGKEVINQNLSPNQLNTVAMNHEKGYYIVKVVSDGTIKTQKVFIK